MVTAVVLGATGYGGGELLRLLHGHPEVEFIDGWSRTRAGKPLGSVHPNLRSVIPGDFSAEQDWEAYAECERLVVFSAMPHGEFAGRLPGLELAWEQAGLLPKLTVIDLSGDFRLRDDRAYEEAYHMAHPCPEHLSRWVYGLSEWNRTQIRKANRIANPGCFATAMALAMAPLIQLGVGRVSVFGITGSSGSGATPTEVTHHPTRDGDFRAYKMLRHQHEYEVRQVLRDHGADGLEFSFIPHSAPLVRGIFITAQFALPVGTTEDDLREAYHRAYGKEERSFVRLMEGSPRLAAVTGSNFVDLSLSVKSDEAVVMVALDNLMKGMASQAVQNMNLALGLPEESGLWFPGIYPG